MTGGVAVYLASAQRKKVLNESAKTRTETGIAPYEQAHKILATDVDTLKARLDDYRQYSERLESRIDKLTTDGDALRKEIDELRKNNLALVSEVQQLKQRVGTLEEEVLATRNLLVEDVVPAVTEVKEAIAGTTAGTPTTGTSDTAKAVGAEAEERRPEPA